MIRKIRKVILEEIKSIFKQVPLKGKFFVEITFISYIIPRLLLIIFHFTFSSQLVDETKTRKGTKGKVKGNTPSSKAAGKLGYL